MLEPGLESLLGTSPWAFFTEVFTRRVLSFSHPPAALEQLIADLGGLDLQTLLDGPRRPGVLLSCPDREAWFSTASSAEALEAYAEGYTAYFHVGQLRPTLLRWVDAIAEAFGVPVDDVDISVFASPPGAQTPLHYDAGQNLTLQLAGHKRWQLGANQQVDFPAENWVPGDPPSPHWRTGTWSAGPEGAEPIVELETLELGPGHGLYVPGGHWHAVESLDHSLAITWSINPARRRDLILAAVAAVLDAQDNLRSSVLTMGSQGLELPIVDLSTAAQSGAGLHAALWRTLSRAPGPLTPGTVAVAIAACELDPEALTEHAWVTLYRALDVFEWTAAGRAHLEARLRG